MPRMTLGVAIVFVKDMKRMADFYHEALGLPLVAAPPGAGLTTGWVELDAGSVRLALHAIPPRVAKQIEITSPPRAREEAAIKLVFQVDDLADARRRLTSHGATMFEPKTWSACDGLDPEGNVFQIVGP